MRKCLPKLGFLDIFGEGVCIYNTGLCFFSFVLQKTSEAHAKKTVWREGNSGSLYFSFQEGARLRERDWERREENRR